MVKVSIIVPVWGVEKYIDKCLKSLVNQTLQDIEIIVVNDESPDNSQKIKTVFKQELQNLLKKTNISDQSTCLVIGLGNEKSTPDAVGPLTIKKTIVTNHLYIYGQLEEGFKRVFAMSPGVMGETGIETSDLIKGVVNQIKPDFVITVDALASSSIERVNKQP